MLKIIGHHGTKRESVQGILQSGFSKSEKEQWFGEGIYFFEDDPLGAKNFAIKVRCFVHNWVVLRAEMCVRNSECISNVKEEAV